MQISNGLTVQEVAEIEARKMVDHGVSNRDLLLKQIRKHLIHHCGTTWKNADIAACRAIATIAAAKSHLRIDVNKSTSTCLFVNVKGGLRVMTLPDIERALNDPGETL